MNDILDNTTGYYTTSPQTKQTIDALWRLEKIILDTLDFNQVVQKIVDSVLSELGYLRLGYHIVVLALVDTTSNCLKRISISQTETAKKALEASPVPFSKIDIPLSANDNLCIQVLSSSKPKSTINWPDILYPPMSKDEALIIQKQLGIKTSMVYPVVSRNKPLGVLIFSMMKNEQEVSPQERDLIAGFTDIVGLAVQNATLYTSLNETSHKLVQAYKKLEGLDRLKDEFVSVASHELRTPMTAIKSYLWLALSGKAGELSEKMKFYLTRAYNSTDRLIKLVNDMLNVSRIESGRISVAMKQTNLKTLIDDVITEVLPRAQELGIKIATESVDNLPDVIADPDKIKEVIINLIGNSLKFTPKGGLIKVNCGVKDENVITSVIDNGQGIEKEDISKLFQKFGLLEDSYTVNQNAAQGTGLGLYICKSIIEMHRGEIWVHSDGKGKGATFSFSLKAYTPEELERLNKPYKNKGEIGIIHTQI